jgi:hypothetical protein
MCFIQSSRHLQYRRIIIQRRRARASAQARIIIVPATRTPLFFVEPPAGI